MDFILVTVLHYYNHPIYYAFMPNTLFLRLEQAFLNDLKYAEVPRKEFETMIEKYFDTLKN